MAPQKTSVSTYAKEGNPFRDGVYYDFSYLKNLLSVSVISIGTSLFSKPRLAQKQTLKFLFFFRPFMSQVFIEHL